MQMTPWHGDLLFSASDGAHGREPWISDGTAGGTLMLRDFSVGPRSSNPLGFSGGTTRAVFLGGSRHTLRRTDGTSEGTRFLTSSDGRRVPVANDPKRVVGVGFLFAASSALDGELWVTKGWRAGTRRVKDINPGAAGSYPADFIDLTPGDALFHASDGVHGDELWITDGTATGTKLVRDINPA